MLQYARPKFRKRHEIDRMKRIAQEPRYLKQKSQKESTAWKNYFWGQSFAISDPKKAEF